MVSAGLVVRTLVGRRRPWIRSSRRMVSCLFFVFEGLRRLFWLTRGVVKAVVTYGETSHVPGQTWDFGTSTLPGLFPRLDPAACDPFASKIRDYCNFDDPFCASGGNLTVHLEDYFLQYDKEAADFIIAQVTGT